MKAQTLPYLLLTANLIAPALNAAPTGDRIVSGNADIGLDPNDASRTIIDQTSQNVAIDWDSFNIGATESVLFNQPNVDAIALNRDFSGSPSNILGNLDANGNVFLLNTAGVLIGSGASINVGGLLVSDMMISNSAAQSFGNGSGAGTLAFSDQDLAAGGISIMGTISATGVNGLTVMGQYIRVGGATTSSGNTVDAPGHDSQFYVGGSTVLVTDPGGLYGVEISSPVTRDISPAQILFDPLNGGSITTGNGNINVTVQYDSSLDVVAIGPPDNFQYLTIGTNAVSSFTVQAVTLPPTLSSNDKDTLTDTIAESLAEEPQEADSPLLGDATTKSGGSLDNVIQGCQPKDRNDRECIKQNAIKRYLGKLLIGGSLPD